MPDPRPLLWSEPSAIARYSIAVLSVAIAIVVAALLTAFLHTEPIASAMISAVMFAAWFGGLGPGLLAIALAVSAIHYYLVPPLNSFAPKDDIFSMGAAELPRLILFSIASLFIIFLSSAQRAAAQSLRRSRDDLRASARALQQLNDELKAENDQRRQAEETTRQVEARFRAVFETSPVGIATRDTRGRILTANAAFEAMVGYSQLELQALEWHDLCHTDESHLMDLLNDLISQQRSSYDVETRYVRKDGGVIWVIEHTSHVRAMAEDQGFFASISVDVTERKRAGLERRRLAALVEQAADLMAIAELSSGTPVYLNKAGLKMVGFDSWEEASTRRGMHYIFPQDRAFVNDVLWPTVLAKGSWSGEMRFRHFKTGAPIPVLYSAFRIDDPETGEPVNIGNVCRDITDRKRAEAEARENERRYREVQMELAHANRVATMGQLTATIAHEVNQPIAATATRAQAALRWLDREPPELQEVRLALAGIVQDAHRAAGVIGRIRDLIRKSAPKEDRLEINEAIREVIELTRGEAVKNCVTVRLELADGLPFVRGDRIQLQQVILNLVINAVEAMSAISDGSRELLVATRASDGVLVEVRDSGPGFAPGALDHIFDSFYTTKPNGLGLGLSICRSIIEAHDGQMRAAANEPRGAVFGFVLPAKPAATGATERSVQVRKA